MDGTPVIALLDAASLRELVCGALGGRWTSAGKEIRMAHRASGSCGGATRRVAALFLSVGLAVGSFIVPWFASAANASTPVVTNYTGTGLSSPNAITAGPDGALWFTNAGNN